ncbi:MAG: hypothetical protein AABY67_00850, partial [Nitrospirota bacterium]
TDLFVEGALSGEVRTGGPRTFYTAYGDLFASACVILSLVGAALTWRRRPKTMNALRRDDA